MRQGRHTLRSISDPVYPRIDCKILSLTYEVLTTTEPSYLYDLQPHCCTRSSDVVTLARPPLYFSLKANNRSIRHASPRLWNEFSKELRQPVDDESLSLSSYLSLTSSSLHVAQSCYSVIGDKSKAKFDPP